jgi:hypothetical protein
MKTYIISSHTNYDLAIQIVNAFSAEEAEKIALKTSAWDGCEVLEIPTDKKGEVISSFNESGMARYTSGNVD